MSVRSTNSFPPEEARRQRRLPLESYDPNVDFQADTRLQCFLDVVYFDGLAPDEIAQLKALPKWGPGAIAVLSRWAQEMRKATDQLQKSFPSTANGTDELSKLPGYSVDDHAQGSHTFADLLKGYADFLALCERENWTLNATKTMVGFPA